VEGGVFISEIKPAASSMTGEYKGFNSNTNDPSPTNVPEEIKPERNRSKTETDIYTNSSPFMNSSSPFMNSSSQSSSPRARTKSSNSGEIGKETTLNPSKKEKTSNKSSSCSDLPSGWEEVVSDTGTYYYHKVTRISRWDKPDSTIAAAHNARLYESKRQVDEAVLRRKEERDNDKKNNEERLLASEQLKVIYYFNFYFK
jgi:hypothetical protein